MVILREARRDEAAAIAEAHAQAHWETYEPLLGAQARRLDPGAQQLAWLRAFRDGGVIRLAEDEGRIVGVGHLAGATLASLYLRASHRRQGVGRRMLAELLEAARARGV